jgi:hypothetical protein
MTNPSKDIRNSPDPDIAGSYYAMQRAGQANHLKEIFWVVFSFIG